MKPTPSAAGLRSLLRPLFRHTKSPFRRISLALVLAWLVASSATLGQSTVSSESAEHQNTESARDLEQAIQQTLENPNYAWRSEGETAPWMLRFLESIDSLTDQISSWMRAVSRWFEERFGDSSIDLPSASSSRFSPTTVVWVIVGLCLALGLAYWIRMRGRVPAVVAREIAPSLEAISVDEADAASVESERWISWARELEQEGRYRDAVRALYLATLSHLAEGRRIHLARHKSNRDYRRELGRRDGQDAPVFGLFEECIVTFERVWYGRHAASTEVLQGMRAGAQGILAFGPDLAPPAKRSAK